MEFERVADIVAGIPNMSPHEGRRVYEHLRSSGAQTVLELGTAHGVSSAYMGAAVEDLGGSVTTVDHVIATELRDPHPRDVIARTGLEPTIDRVLVDDSSYTWWLKDRIAERSEQDGHCAPIYDFVYIDGAHNWTIDGLATFLVEKLLRPGGWLLLDDLHWNYGTPAVSCGPRQAATDLGLSESEIGEPHMQLVFDLIVRQHPAFSEFRIENEQWGWAKKDPEGSRQVRFEHTAPSLSSRASALSRRAGSKLRAALSR
jgi:predicted O-methyltransferase YrrM